MIYIVTGVSRGVGKGLVESLIDSNKVIGIGRSHSFDHPNFTFLKCDLSNRADIEDLEFNFDKNESVTLINNAGILGDVKRLSDQAVVDFENVQFVNTIAPLLICMKVYGYIEHKSNFVLANISSGAANNPIASWAAYCSSKSGLNMWTQAFKIEEAEKGNFPRVHSISPGIIDSDMQVQIRNSNSKDFSAVDNFIAFKTNNDLFTISECAQRIVRFLKNDDLRNEVLIDIRNV